MLRPVAAVARGSVLALVCAASPAQEPPPLLLVPYGLDSGYVDHAVGQQPLRVIGDVHVEGASWLQLWFGPTELPAGTRLRLTSRLDAGVQWFDAASLRDYGFVSAVFNGDRVEVALLLGKDSRNNRVSVAKVRTGEPMARVSGICGGADTRVLSNDPRIGRLDGCCTAFLVDARTLCTAGHCIRSVGAQMVHFNVPLSTRDGAPRFPPPEDQYALVPASLTAAAGGPGADFAVVAAARNSNTGLYPGEAQGSWFQTAIAGPMTTEVRVTGYGTSAVDRTWSLAQKTHTGPCAAGDAGQLQFEAHLSGCNSGSPIIDTVTGAAVGVATHAGCATFGYNIGTGYGHPRFLAAVRAVRQTVVGGAISRAGRPCGEGESSADLSVSGAPRVGGRVAVAVVGAGGAPADPGLLLVGHARLSPRERLAFGECAPLVAGDAVLPMVAADGAAVCELRLPTDPALLAAQFWCQFATQAANGPVASNLGRVLVGN